MSASSERLSLHQTSLEQRSSPHDSSTILDVTLLRQYAVRMHHAMGEH